MAKGVSNAAVPAGAVAVKREVHDAIVDFRKSGKKAFAYLEYAGEREYFIAAACWP